MGLSVEDQKQLATLLQRVKEEERGYIPDQCLVEYCDLNAQAFTEVTLMRPNGHPWHPTFCLRHRCDQWWPGPDGKGVWHIPGTKHAPRKVVGSPLQIVRTLAKAEFPGINITAAGVVGGWQWQMKEWPEDTAGDHPWCHPFSHVVLCETDVAVPETETTRYFTAKEALALPMPPHHQHFLEVCHHVATTGTPYVYR